MCLACQSHTLFPSWILCEVCPLYWSMISPFTFHIESIINLVWTKRLQYLLLIMVSDYCLLIGFIHGRIEASPHFSRVLRISRLSLSCWHVYFYLWCILLANLSRVQDFPRSFGAQNAYSEFQRDEIPFNKCCFFLQKVSYFVLDKRLR